MEVLLLNINDIANKLIDQTGRKVQCGNNKGSEPAFLLPDSALKTPFIRFGNSYFIPALSLDIDNHKNHASILNTCLTYGLELPTFILDTQKGLHVHWVLNKPIPTGNSKALYKYQKVIAKLASIFDTDLHAVPKNSGRLFRNPLMHPVRLYNDSFLDLIDFTEPLKLYKSIPEKFEAPKRGIFAHYKKPDFSKVGEGARNNTLFDYGRYYAYRNTRAGNLKDNLKSALCAQNCAFREPLSNSEVNSIFHSISTFMDRRYNGKTKNKSVITFNRKLAKKTYDKKQSLLFSKFIELPHITLKDLRTMSLRRGGAVFGVHKNTYKSHLNELIKDIKSLSKPSVSLWVTEPVFEEAFINILNYTPQIVYKNTS